MFKKSRAFFLLLPVLFANRFSYAVCRFNGWLAKRDTVYAEGMLSMLMIANGMQVLAVGDNGKSLAPFLDTALSFLVLNKFVWIFSFLFIGSLKMLALVHGQIHGNGYLWRARMAFVASILWSLVWLAIVFSSQPKIVAFRYFIAWLGSVGSYLALQNKLKVEQIVAQGSLDFVGDGEADACRLKSSALEPRFVRH